MQILGPTVSAQCQQEGRAPYRGASRRSTSSSAPTGRPQRAGCTAGTGERVRIRGARPPPTAPCPPRPPPSQPTFINSRCINVWKRRLLSLSCCCTSSRSCRPIDSMAGVAHCLGTATAQARSQLKRGAPRANRVFQKYLRNRSCPRFRPPLPGSTSGGNAKRREEREGPPKQVEHAHYFMRHSLAP